MVELPFDKNNEIWDPKTIQQTQPSEPSPLEREKERKGKVTRRIAEGVERCGSRDHRLNRDPLLCSLEFFENLLNFNFIFMGECLE